MAKNEEEAGAEASRLKERTQKNGPVAWISSTLTHERTLPNFK